MSKPAEAKSKLNETKNIQIWNLHFMAKAFVTSTFLIRLPAPDRLSMHGNLFLHGVVLHPSNHQPDVRLTKSLFFLQQGTHPSCDIVVAKDWTNELLSDIEQIARLDYGISRMATRSSARAV
jgi:hypothetical protein